MSVCLSVSHYLHIEPRQGDQADSLSPYKGSARHSTSDDSHVISNNSVLHISVGPNTNFLNVAASLVVSQSVSQSVSLYVRFVSFRAVGNGMSGYQHLCKSNCLSNRLHLL